MEKRMEEGREFEVRTMFAGSVIKTTMFESEREAKAAMRNAEIYFEEKGPVSLSVYHKGECLFLWS